MEDEKTIIWSFRIVSVLAILIPLIFYYLVAPSPQDFFMPDFVPLTPDLRFQITSINFNNTNGNTYLLRIGLVNTGNMTVGLKKFEGRLNVPTLDFSGRLLLQSPFTLSPGVEEELQFLYMLEEGDPDDFQHIFIQRPMVNLSGNATLILDSAEIPFEFSISIPSG